jgi:hypothetical protein
MPLHTLIYIQYVFIKAELVTNATFTTMKPYEPKYNDKGEEVYMYGKSTYEDPRAWQAIFIIKSHIC